MAIYKPPCSSCLCGEKSNAPQRHREHKENLCALRAFVVKKVMHHRDTEDTKKKKKI
jgi:hypothetical protein